MSEISARHILVKDEEVAREISEKLTKGGEFSSLASEYSQCPSGKRGGHLGAFKRGMMVKEFEDAAFALKEEEISAPVQTQFGFHIIQRLANS